MSDRRVTESDTLEIHLEPVGSHSAKGALLSAVVGAGGGPLYQFVAAASNVDSRHPEHAAIGTTFPLESFQDLEDQTDNEWTAGPGATPRVRYGAARAWLASTP